jgi:2-(1,2-epoxy-1,2-dihydrophenyl)acetyl-CoA isomerase
MNDTVLLARQGPVATLTLNRPDVLNVLDAAMIEALAAHALALAADREVRVVIVAGAGPHFMAGGDIRMFASLASLPPPERSARFESLIVPLHGVLEQLVRLPQPVIARVHGACAGFGLSLMAACDLAIAADDAYFTSAYRHIGLTPDGSGTWFLPRIVGPRKAMELVLLSPRLTAAEALAIGLVNKVVPRDELDAAVASATNSLAIGARLALANAKRLVRDSLDRTLPEQLAAEARSIAQCAGTADFVEGVTAFVAKRPPKFGGG